jgi:hypothetical protein
VNDKKSFNSLLENVHQKTLVMRNIDTFVNSDTFEAVYLHLDDVEVRRLIFNFNCIKLKNYCYNKRLETTKYEHLTVRELRQLASKRKIKGYTNVGKGALITLLKKKDRN